MPAPNPATVDAAALQARLLTEVADLTAAVTAVKDTTAAADAAQASFDTTFSLGQAALDALHGQQQAAMDAKEAEVKAADDAAQAVLATAVRARDAATAMLAAEIAFLGKLVASLGGDDADDPTPDVVPVAA